MSIGINQLLQTLTYYVLGCTLIENQIPSTAISLTLMYQAAAMFVLYMDVVGVKDLRICGIRVRNTMAKMVVGGIQLIGSVPAVMVLISLTIADREETGLSR
eukprot:SRR837773.26849.p3 GENE.SRR837773.26849~~SRR837773.26849.p3  ORF type:complete len:102 (+),score=30.68 SRR837773.26849:385-690(+)